MSVAYTLVDPSDTSLVTFDTVDVADWSVDAGSTIGLQGGLPPNALYVELVNDGSDEFLKCSVTGLVEDAYYWLHVQVDSVTTGFGTTGTPGELMIRNDNHAQDSDFTAINATTGVLETADFYEISDVGADAPGTYHVKVQATGSGPWILNLGLTGDSADPDYLKITDINLWDVRTDPDETKEIAWLGDREEFFSASMGKNTDNTLIQRYPEVEEIVAVGDMAATANSYATINDTLADSITGRIWPAAGNHDYDRTPIDSTGNFLDYFDNVPDLSPGQGTRGTYYRKVFGHVEYFFVDTNSENGDTDITSAAAFRASKMGQWLVTALADSKARWRIVVGHHPPYSSITAPDGTSFPALRQPDWDELGAHLVLTGHTHSTEVLNDGKVYHVVLGMGGAPHHAVTLIDDNPLTPQLVDESEWHATPWTYLDEEPVIIRAYDGDLDTRTLVLEFVKYTGQLIQTLTLTDTASSVLVTGATSATITSDFRMRAGDRYPNLQAILKDSAGTAIDLTNMRRVVFAYGPRGKRLRYTDCAVTDASAGTVKASWSAADAAAWEGGVAYKGAFQVEESEGNWFSVPNDSHITWTCEVGLL